HRILIHHVRPLAGTKLSPPLMSGSSAEVITLVGLNRVVTLGGSIKILNHLGPWPSGFNRFDGLGILQGTPPTSAAQAADFRHSEPPERPTSFSQASCKP